MSSAWLLPQHIADVLPREARHIEELRRGLLDAAAGYGYELVIPPLLEHIESLLSGTGRELGLQTFKLVDQLSGRTLGVRADSTSQVARIDAHLLNRTGVTRLCYCGPVLHTRPAGMHASREPLQFGAEIYGHASLEADLEIQDLALDSLRRAGVAGVTLDLGDSRIVRALLEPSGLTAVQLDAVYAALAAKDGAALREATTAVTEPARAGLLALLGLYGGREVIEAASKTLPPSPGLLAALGDLDRLAAHALDADDGVVIGVDLADIGGYAYYSGPRFAIYAEGASDAIARGGRYDEIGAVFGRSRPAVGFSLDLKELSGIARQSGPRAAIRAPWSEDASLRAAVRRLREGGEVVVCVLPGHDTEGDGFTCDRELAPVGGQWSVSAL